MNLSFAPRQLVRMTSAQLRSAFGLIATPWKIDDDQWPTTDTLDRSARALVFKVKRGQKR